MKGFFIFLLSVVLFGGGFFLGTTVAGKCVRDVGGCFDCLRDDAPLTRQLGLESCLWLRDAKRHVEDAASGAAGAVESTVHTLLGK